MARLKRVERFSEKSHENVIDGLVQQRIRLEFSEQTTLINMLKGRGMTYERFRQQVKQEVETKPTKSREDRSITGDRE